MPNDTISNKLNTSGRELCFAARCEQSLRIENGMGTAPTYHFQDKPQLPWEILGIAQTAEISEIQSAYEKLAVVLHPANSGGKTDDYLTLILSYNYMLFHRRWVDRVCIRPNGVATEANIDNKASNYLVTLLREQDCHGVRTAKQLLEILFGPEEAQRILTEAENVYAKSLPKGDTREIKYRDEQAQSSPK